MIVARKDSTKHLELRRILLATTVAPLGSCYVRNRFTSKIRHFQILSLQKYVASLKLLRMRRSRDI